MVPQEQAAGGRETVPAQRGAFVSQPRADRAVLERSVVLQSDGRSPGWRGAARNGARPARELTLPRRERRRSVAPLLPRALRQDLPVLARKPPRLVHQPTVVVG